MSLLSVRSFFRQAGLGRWLFKVALDPAKPWGYGFWRGCRFVWGQRSMRRAAARLPPIPPAVGPALLAPTFMTGTDFWHQTVFCLHSLARVCKGRIAPRIVDDGTLQPVECDHIRRIFSGAAIVCRNENQAALERELPRKKYPVLRQIRDRVKMMRKFTDIRIGSRVWQLYLDSDMLFYQPPEFLFECARSSAACYMIDVVDGYVLPPQALELMAGRPVPSRVNAGIVALRDDELDWPGLEAMCASQTAELREHRLFEQTLTAILLARANGRAAPPTDYAMVTAVDGSPDPTVVMAHFIIRGKYPYQVTQWRKYCRQLA